MFKGQQLQIGTVKGQTTEKSWLKFWLAVAAMS